MGYSLHRQLVEQNLSLLDDILANLQQGKETIIPATPDEISTISYSINRILKAAQMFSDIHQGRYSLLREKVTVRPHPKGTHISIQPKGKASAQLAIPKNTEAWVLLFLDEYQGNLVPVEFHPSPSFDESSFAEQVDSLGWIMHISTRQEEEDKLTYAFERKSSVEKRGFDLIG